MWTCAIAHLLNWPPSNGSVLAYTQGLKPGKFGLPFPETS